MADRPGPPTKDAGSRGCCGKQCVIEYALFTSVFIFGSILTVSLSSLVSLRIEASGDLCETAKAGVSKCTRALAVPITTLTLLFVGMSASAPLGIIWWAVFGPASETAAESRTKSGVRLAQPSARSGGGVPPLINSAINERESSGILSTATPPVVVPVSVDQRSEGGPVNKAADVITEVPSGTCCTCLPECIAPPEGPLWTWPSGCIALQSLVLASFFDMAASLLFVIAYVWLPASVVSATRGLRMPFTAILGVAAATGCGCMPCCGGTYQTNAIRGQRAADGPAPGADPSQATPAGIGPRHEGTSHRGARPGEQDAYLPLLAVDDVARHTIGTGGGDRRLDPRQQPVAADPMSPTNEGYQARRSGGRYLTDGVTSAMYSSRKAESEGRCCCPRGGSADVCWRSMVRVLAQSADSSGMTSTEWWFQGLGVLGIVMVMTSATIAAAATGDTKGGASGGGGGNDSVTETATSASGWQWPGLEVQEHHGAHWFTGVDGHGERYTLNVLLTDTGSDNADADPYALAVPPAALAALGLLLVLGGVVVASLQGVLEQGLMEASTGGLDEGDQDIGGDWSNGDRIQEGMDPSKPVEAALDSSQLGGAGAAHLLDSCGDSSDVSVRRVAIDRRALDHTLGSYSTLFSLVVEGLSGSIMCAVLLAVANNVRTSSGDKWEDLDLVTYAWKHDPRVVKLALIIALVLVPGFSASIFAMARFGGHNFRSFALFARTAATLAIEKTAWAVEHAEGHTGGSGAGRPSGGWLFPGTPWNRWTWLEVGGLVLVLCAGFGGQWARGRRMERGGEAY